MIVRSAPGKLFVAGEYAVVEPGFPAVIVAVDRLLTVAVSDATGATILSSDLYGGIAVRCERIGRRLTVTSGSEPRIFDHILSAINVVEQYAHEWRIPVRPFRLRAEGQFTQCGSKLGLGSSAAVIVATIDAMTSFYGLEPSRMDRYRLAMLALLAISPRASGGDIAASTWGGWIAYRSPVRERITTLTGEKGITAALCAEWPGLAIEELPTPPRPQLLVGWTGAPSATDSLVAGLDHRIGALDGYYSQFLADSAACVERLVTAVRAQNVAAICHEIRCARGILAKLDQCVHLGIMTPLLTALCTAADEIGAAAKPSGAGGGDCGIAMAYRADDAARLISRWAECGIHTLPVKVHERNNDAIL
ncbi:phosphomevalonate kinase [Nocardia otitidiscaviarum]|uniref:phosphomevalonate kinase n=1 Tax=Nocardia otitidiscaviarum TaxID=1823 RepID=UPI0024584DB2|nr:phosphomevalonate kinase [Nocardia otitidiscaviarum]